MKKINAKILINLHIGRGFLLIFWLKGCSKKSIWCFGLLYICFLQMFLAMQSIQPWLAKSYLYLVLQNNYLHRSNSQLWQLQETEISVCLCLYHVAESAHGDTWWMFIPCIIKQLCYSKSLDDLLISPICFRKQRPGRYAAIGRRWCPWWRPGDLHLVSETSSKILQIDRRRNRDAGILQRSVLHALAPCVLQAQQGV